MAPLILLAAWLLVLGYALAYHGSTHFSKPVRFWWALTGQGSQT
jgi:hypothetical protein